MHNLATCEPDVASAEGRGVVPAGEEDDGGGGGDGSLTSASFAVSIAGGAEPIS